MLISFLSFNCSSSVSQKLNGGHCNKAIQSITISNKTNNHYIADKIDVADPNVIAQICSEIDRLRAIPSVDVRGFGFYQMRIHLVDKTAYTLFVHYTVYDGVVIREANNKCYKNDKLESVILSLFQ